MVINQAAQLLRRHYLPILGVLLVLYFLKPALQGQMGFFRYLQVQAQIEQLSIERDELVAEREYLENLTKRLSNNYLDLDLLDEQARKKLGLIRDNEIIIR